MKNKRLFLLDAYALIFRAYYALIKMPRMTQSGFNTSAIFGFVNTLEELLRKEHPTHIAVCFDPAGPTFRSEAYEAYKGEREATPEDIKKSVPIIKEIIKAYNIKAVECEGFEADDVIGTLATKAAAEDFTTYMMTPDKDFGQLVGPEVLQYKPGYRGQDFELRGEEEVCARYGLQNTRQVIDLLALMGDKIDNIPGCPGVGEKTAVKLIQEFGDVDTLLASTDKLKGALKKKVEENVEQIKFSRYLATIRTDVPVDVDLEELLLQAPDRDKLFAIFRELEFKSLEQRVSKRLDAEAKDSTEASNLEKSAVEDASVLGGLFAGLEYEEVSEHEEAHRPNLKIDMNSMNFKAVRTPEDAREFSDALIGADSCGVYIHAEGDNDMMAEFKVAAVTLGDCGWVISPGCREGVAAMLDLFARGDIEKVSMQSKRDYVVAHILRGDSADPLVNYYDVSLAHYLLQPEMRHTLDILASGYLKYDVFPVPVSLSGKRPAKGAPTFDPFDPEVMAFCCERAMITEKLRPLLEQELKEENLNRIMQEIELPLVPVLADMEIAGVRIDDKALDEAANTLRTRLEEIERKVYDLVGEEFNIGSPAQVGEILFDKLQLDPKAKKTKTGQYSTSEDILEKLILKHPVVALILEYRQLKKLLSTYLTALPEAINPATGKVHTNYNQTVTATGRISSSYPNLQNIPVREALGREIRRAFIPDEGHLFLSADYSQIELRLVADFSHDEIMLDAFRHGEDIHAITAAKIYHKNPEDVTSDERRHAKTANFGILYGISAFGLSQRLGIPRQESKVLIDNYFATFPTIRKYMQDSIEYAREHGYVITRMGRKRRLPDILSKNPVVRGYAERNAINAPVQGSAADIIKKAMVDIFAEMRRLGMKSKMIMQVHDELNFDVVPDELPQLQELVARLMEGAYVGDVTLSASSGVAGNWLDAH